MLFVETDAFLPVAACTTARKVTNDKNGIDYACMKLGVEPAKRMGLLTGSNQLNIR